MKMFEPTVYTSTIFTLSSEKLGMAAGSELVSCEKMSTQMICLKGGTGIWYNLIIYIFSHLIAGYIHVELGQTAVVESR